MCGKDTEHEDAGKALDGQLLGASGPLPAFVAHLPRGREGGKEEVSVAFSGSFVGAFPQALPAHRTSPEHPVCFSPPFPTLLFRTLLHNSTIAPNSTGSQVTMWNFAARGHREGHRNKQL